MFIKSITFLLCRGEEKIATTVTWFDVLNYYFVELLYPYFRDRIYPRFLDIVTAPVDNLEMLWLIAPLIVTMFLVQIYFGRHKNEELGWNTAYGNTIVLIFTTVTLFHYLYRTYGYEAMVALEGTAFYKSLFVAIGLLYAFVLLLIDFTHLLPKKLAFFLSSAITVGVSAFITVVLVYSEVPFDSITLVTAICLFLIVYIFFKLFRMLIPASETAEKFLERQEEKKEAKKAEKKLEHYRKAKHIEQQIKEEIGHLAEKTGEKLEKVKNFFKK